MMLKKVDRRIQRTQQLLHDALMALIIERGYQAVTIQDIVDRADVSRTTFYLHYKDKDDLLYRMTIGMFEHLFSGFGGIDRAMLLNGEADSAYYDASDFEHVAQYADFYRAMLSEKGSPRLLMQILDYLTAMFRDEVLLPLVDPLNPPPMAVDFIAAYIAGGEISLVRWWLENGMQQTPQEMATMMFDLCQNGTNWALRLNLPREE